MPRSTLQAGKLFCHLWLPRALENPMDIIDGETKKTWFPVDFPWNPSRAELHPTAWRKWAFFVQEYWHDWADSATTFHMAGQECTSQTSTRCGDNDSHVGSPIKFKFPRSEIASSQLHALRQLRLPIARVRKWRRWWWPQKPAALWSFEPGNSMKQGAWRVLGILAFKVSCTHIIHHLNGFETLSHWQLENYSL